MTDLKQKFLSFVKTIKDDEASRGLTTRIFSWQELQEDLQLSVAQRSAQVVSE